MIVRNEKLEGKNKKQKKYIKKNTGAGETQTKEKSCATIAGSEEITNRTNNIKIVVASKD